MDTKKDLRNYENVKMILDAKEITTKTYEMQQGSEYISTLLDGDLIGLKSIGGPCCAWGAKSKEDMAKLINFMEGPFKYYYTKDEFVPESKDPPIMRQEMWRSFDDFNFEFEVENLTIKISSDLEEIKKFCDIIERAYTNCSSDYMYELFKLIPEHYVMAYKDGIMVGGFLMTVAEGSSCIYFNSVLPEYRGQKISKAMIVKGFKLAEELGAKEMVFHASPLGEPVYRSLGFKYVKEWFIASIEPGSS